MALIPNSINGVLIEFADPVNADVHPTLIAALRQIIKPAIAEKYTLLTLYVSSANDQHVLPSRHAIGKGIDISRINGKKLSLFYSSIAELQAISDAIQEAFETYPARRENFGPLFCKKLGHPFGISGHRDHIHLSVN